MLNFGRYLYCSNCTSQYLLPSSFISLISWQAFRIAAVFLHRKIYLTVRIRPFTIGSSCDLYQRRFSKTGWSAPKTITDILSNVTPRSRIIVVNSMSYFASRIFWTFPPADCLLKKHLWSHISEEPLEVWLSNDASSWYLDKIKGYGFL